MSKIERNIHHFRFARLMGRKLTREWFINMIPLFSEKTIAELRAYLRSQRFDDKNAAYPDQE